MEKPAFKFFVCDGKNKDSCKRENLFLIPLLPSKNSGSQGVCPLLNRDCRLEDVNQGSYIAQDQEGGAQRSRRQNIEDLQCGGGSMGG